MKLALLVGLAFLQLSFPEHCAASRSENAREAQSWIGFTKQAFIIGVWQPYLKTVNSCSNFRLDTTPALFRVWPEPHGEFCCEDRLTNQTIASYVFSETDGRFLQPIVYYDVGIVDGFTPFWLSWRFDRISQKDITNLAYCEVNDLKRFYIQRFLRKAMAKQGLSSGMLFIVLVEIVVLLSALPQKIKSIVVLPSALPRKIKSIVVLLSALPQKIKSKLSSRSRVAPLGQTLNPVLARLMASTRFPTFLGWETTWDLLHLLFLGVNGSLLMEAVGHSDPCGWEAVVLYNSAVVYTYLTLLSILSAVVQQTALWSRATTNDRLQRVKKMAPEKIVEEADWKEERHTIEKEWQLQRISTQCAVVFVGSLYCTFVTVYSRNEFVAWLLGIIILAQVWSCTVGLVVLFKALRLGWDCKKQRDVAKKLERDVAKELERELAAQAAERPVNP